MIGFFFFIAILDVALGFGLAWFLCRRQLRAARAVAVPVSAGRALVAPRPPAPVAPPPPRPHDELEQELLASATVLAGEMAVAQRAKPEPARSSGDSSLAAPPARPSAAENVPTAATGTQTAAAGLLTGSGKALRRIGGQVEVYQDQLSQLDQKLRSLTRRPEQAAIASCLSSLSAVNGHFAAENAVAERLLDEAAEEHAGLESLRQALRSAVQMQKSQIEKTDRALRQFNDHEDLGKSCQDMLAQTGKLLEVNHRLRDTLDEAFAAGAEGSSAGQSAPPETQLDPLTGLLNRGGWEQTLVTALAGQRAGAPAFPVALLDFDHFGQINEHYGSRTGDGILQAVARLLQAENAGVRLARLAGQRFALHGAAAEMHAMTNRAERMRQMVEQLAFRSGDETIHITLSCGVVQSAAGDAPETLMGRAEAALREAKRYGRNRSFQHESDYPTPVVPPNFALESREVLL